MNTYKATVITTFCQGSVEHTTYIGAHSATEARATLEREGFEVILLWVLELAL